MKVEIELIKDHDWYLSELLPGDIFLYNQKHFIYINNCSPKNNVFNLELKQIETISERECVTYLGALNFKDDFYHKDDKDNEYIQNFLKKK